MFNVYKKRQFLANEEELSQRRKVQQAEFLEEREQIAASLIKEMAAEKEVKR